MNLERDTSVQIKVITEELGKERSGFVTIMRHRIDPECVALDVYHGS